MSLAVLGRLGVAALVTVFTAAVARGLRVLVLRALGAVAADAVINV